MERNGVESAVIDEVCYSWTRTNGVIVSLPEQKQYKKIKNAVGRAIADFGPIEEGARVTAAR